MELSCEPKHIKKNINLGLTLLLALKETKNEVASFVHLLKNTQKKKNIFQT